MNTHGSTDDLDTALAHVRKILQSRPDLAEEQALAILNEIPDELNAMFLLGAARRLQHKNAEALPVLEKTVAMAPDFAVARKELGLTFLALERPEEAIAAFRKALEIEPRIPTAWKALAELLRQKGDLGEAQGANQEFVKLTLPDSDLARSANHLFAGELREAEGACRKALDRNPKDAAALQMAGEICTRMGNIEGAEHFLKQCLDEAPDIPSVRQSYASILARLEKHDAALAQLDILLQSDPDNPAYLALKATTLTRTGNYDDALPIYEEILSRLPDLASVLLDYAHALRALGRQEDAVETYRKCIVQEPGLGEAWYSLANLKTVKVTNADIDIMRKYANTDGLSPRDSWHLCFALGKALEDKRDFNDAFDYYQQANKSRRNAIRYSADANQKSFEDLKTFFSKDFFTKKERRGCLAPDPIFILGLPRAGSTMLEQILASHSQIEGTMELPDISAIARQAGGATGQGDAMGPNYPYALSAYSNLELTVLGEDYLNRTRQYRTDLPFFIDKMPSNFAHIGMIHLILPNARIIDARRHPMACCFSAYKQLFGKGHFSYDLEELGRYYQDYVSLMDHWDEVLPGRVLRVQYEDVVADVESQVRRILDYCGLPFEEQCLRFHETERVIRTASSEQVRQPLHSNAIEHWRNFLPHLDPLVESLGPVLDRYPIK